MAFVSPLKEIVSTHQERIAYAVGLLKSKPEQLSAREYLRILKQHEANGRREHALSSTYSHLDRSSYWRSECLREAEEKIALKEELDDLRLEHDRLKTKIELMSPIKKRKKVDEDVVLVPRSPKKSKNDTSTNKKNAGTEEAIANFDFTSIGEAGNILMRSFFQINAILKSNQKTDHVRLAFEAVRAASTIPQVLQRTISHDDSNGADNLGSLKLVLTACSRAILSLIMAFNRLSHIADGAQVQGKVTYAYVKMFAKVGNTFSEIAKKEVTIPSNDNDSNIALKNGNPKGKTKQLKASSNRTTPRLSLFTDFVGRILDSLESKNEAQNLLFEGFAHIILERVGSCLFVSHFGHTRGKTIEAEIASTNLDDQIANTAELTLEERDMRAERLLAPYLVQLFNHVMKAAPAHLGSIFRTTNGRAVLTNKNSSMKGALTIKAKERLQRTLVNCTFGTENNDGNESIMRNCLKMPSISDALITLPKIKEAEVFNWFSEEVWRLLGWDILSKDVDV